jgi:glucose-1-phosphate adenylyltransferase
LESYEFGRDVVPRMMTSHKVYGFLFDDYWGYARTIDDYYQATQDLILGRIDIDGWDIRTNLVESGVANVPPTRVHSGAEVRNSRISPGCEIEGTVRGSVLSPGCWVGRGAIVESSILFNRAQVKEGAHVERAILDKDVVVGRDCRIGGPPMVGLTAEGDAPTSLGITVVGKGSRISSHSVVPPGEVIPLDMVWEKG